MAGSEAPFLRPANRAMALFSGGVVGWETCGPAPEAQLHPGEAELVRNAVERRRQEFAGGRLCARRALAELDIFDFPLLVAENRFPIWPEEVVGSISHTRGYCGAVAARRSDYDGLGIDVELRGRLNRKLESRICTEEERSWLASLPESERGDMATVLFSAKEAFYKCQYCVTRQWLGFHDASLKIGADSFEVQLLKPIPYFRERAEPLTGHFAVAGEHVFAGIELRRLREPRS